MEKVIKTIKNEWNSIKYAASYLLINQNMLLNETHLDYDIGIKTFFLTKKGDSLEKLVHIQEQIKQVLGYY